MGKSRLATLELVSFLVLGTYAMTGRTHHPFISHYKCTTNI